ncbi:MAG: hypothetical protein HN729_04055 [Candidatus Marinimicrobia bacterium]|jgi:hypothetical protein|nr:hypothetical protein [Candidatus Neomarinimicrobiota bacterium]MBT3633731.1 hypothetical protein [Candidatus Neomarinimicrobiota bacterium]MBT3682523.1 hypothetical protein [Candidatus Neomarinimicrobiota bacterium]MBT3759287.1 hypothetical protein [Candidatus Neomarinimicrobiota bacterium]MBT3894705.1 hypothetical protein [Candidatus Neomarinimicrobiota bacterium]
MTKMTFTKNNIVILTLFTFFTILSGESRIINHYLYLDIKPETNTLTARDKVLIETSDRYWEFKLSSKAEITELRVDDEIREYEIRPVTDSDSRLDLKLIRIQRKMLEKSEKIIDISYTGVFHHDVESTEFSREKIAMEVNATISNEGVFLSPSSGFYPMSSEKLSSFDTVIKLPTGWDAVSEGKLIKAEKSDEKSVINYKSLNPLDAIHVTAAIWVVESQIVDGIEFYTYFFKEDSSLAAEYMNMSIEYVKMYSEMISPYPFSKFAVVENFFPTGYGMPSYTVLGRSVVRLPFIVYTSLGHEVLHNWWGNSVYVGDKGNWCEGLTTYQADYLYKLQNSSSSARQYRKDILKDFTIYVNEKNDISPAGFISRTDMASRSIGYGKVAMIFHMMEERLGKERFLQALQNVVAQAQFTHANWDDFFTAMENVSNEDFSEFQEKWVSQSGAPTLNLTEDDDKVYLHQSGVIKPMWIQISYLYDNGTKIIKEVYSNSEKERLYPPESDGLVGIRADENYHVMRRLHETEMDPTIREIISEEDYVFVVPEQSDEWKEIARSFNGYLSEGSELDIRTQPPLENDRIVIYLGVQPEFLSHLKLNGNIKVNDEILDASEHCLVWAYKNSDDNPGLVIYSSNSRELIPIARKLPHYGKYGYLVFNHGQNIIKGNHESIESPLVWQK